MINLGQNEIERLRELGKILKGYASDSINRPFAKSN